MLSFIALVLACFCFAGATISIYIRPSSPPNPPYPWYGGLVTAGLFLWSLSEVILRWPGNGGLH
jgi:hypothetical protein